MFDSLTDKLQGVFRRLGGRGTITEKDLDEALREVRLALLEADVNYKVVRDFIAGVRERALGADVTKSLTPAQAIIDLVNQEMIELLGGGQAKLERAKNPPTVIMLVGLKGGGKTTTVAKLALHLRREGQTPIMVTTDPERVAASEQIEALAKQLNIPAVSFGANVKPTDAAKKGLEEAKRKDQQDLKALHKALSPTEVLLVADAMTGQEAVHAAEEFNKAVPLTGLILTKLDGDARGGAALSIRAVTGVPIKFVGVGEKADALETFYPDRFASRILGMGDMLTLIEKAKEELSDTDVESLTVRMKKGDLTLDDFLEQYQRIKRMGPLPNLIGMIPGLSQIKNRLNLEEMDDKYFAQVEAVIYSMTKEERAHPDIIDGSRRRRIAAGSGTTAADINRLLKQYHEAKKIIQQISTGKGPDVTSFLR
jgi:signal recognition particle subunit SRP54